MSSIEAPRHLRVALHRTRRPALIGGVVAGLAMSLSVLISGAPVAWWLLGLCAVLVLGVLIVALAEGRYFEPLTVVAAFAAMAFVIRPLYLFLNSTELISYMPPHGTSAVKTLLRLDNSEIAMFATTKLHGALQPALTRAIGACAVFLVAFLAGYLIPLGKRLGRRLATAKASTAQLNVRAAVGISLAIGLIGQVAIVAKTGGLSKAANRQLQQTALSAGLVYYILAGFSVAGVIIWAAWMRPRTRRAWAGFAVAALWPSLFYVLVGSRTHVLALALALVVVAHYRWRRLRLREVVVAFVVGIALSAAMLAVRQATREKPFTRALGSAPAYIVDPRGALDDLTQFDDLFYATSSIGVTLPYKHGGWIGDAFSSYIPRFLDSHKPQPPDIIFREDVFGNTVGAGRPPTLVGDLYFDFGLAAVAVGCVIFGLLARILLCLLSEAEDRGRPFRVALYSLSLFVLYELVSNGYAVAIGFFLTLIVPFLLAVLVFGRVKVGTGRVSGRAWSPATRRALREGALIDS